VVIGLIAVGLSTIRAADEEVPAPFRSAGLYEIARNLFQAGECRMPEPGEAPVAETLPHTEMLKCYHGPYSGVFICSERGDFLDNRRVFLSKAEGEPRMLEGPPAGQSGPIDGVQVSFLRQGSNAPRVYWDSPSASCAGELQTYTASQRATINYWRTGNSP